MADIRIDTHNLTYTQFVIPEQNSGWIEGANSPVISLESGEYGFQQISGIVANFRFKVTPDGLIDYDVINDELLSGRGTTTLTVKGFTIVVDGRALSHDLQPTIIGGSNLSRSSIHELTLVPAVGYSFLSASGIVADFRFDVTIEGQVMVDPRYTGFATAAGQALTIIGYQVTIDGRALSHDLLPVSMLGDMTVMTRDRTHNFTYIPAAGYGFQPAAGLVADFHFDVTVDSNLVVDARYGGFATSVGRTLILNGYKITIDSRDLSHNLVPVSLLGNENVLSLGHIHELTLMPASPYVFNAPRETAIEFRFALNTNGGINILGVPGGFRVTRPVPPPATLRSFYADQFLPPRGSVEEFCRPTRKYSLRQAIGDHREIFFNGFTPLRDIDNLFRGSTSEEEEDQALAILLGCSKANDLIYLVNKLTWDQLDDELDEGDLTQIMDRLRVLLDHRDYLVGSLLRWFFLVENERLPNIDFINNLIPFATTRTSEVRHSIADQSLNQRDAVLDGLAHMALRGLPTYAAEFRLILDIAAGAEQYKTAELQRLSWEVFYTDLICTQLARGEYGLLMSTLSDLYNSDNAQFPVRNVALFYMLRRWDRQFVAMERLISVLGSERQKADARRYMKIRRRFMDNFPALVAPPAPQGAFLTAIQQASQSITTFLRQIVDAAQDLVGATQAVATLIANISAEDLLGMNDDNNARAAVNIMSSEDLLAILPFRYKFELINKMQDGPTLDEDEDAILTILRQTKTLSPAEFLQLTAAATWEALDTDFDGEQYDQLEALFRF